MAPWGRSVLVTGGSGSFGRACIRTLLALDPAVEIVSVSRNAEARYRLEAACPTPRLTVVPGDVRVPADLARAFDRQVDTVIHAAAEKHVGTGERYAAYTEAINFLGAKHVWQAAHAAGATKLLALSTDKACLPETFYGETKAAAERWLLSKHDPWLLRCSVVRYGNVAASSGSVIPLFLQQKHQGVLTVTDRRMSRFWMPLSDDADVQLFQEPGALCVMSAVRWVLLALEHMRGGEIFVPEIPGATVETLARAIAPDARVVEIGVRPGEKLTEDLISPEEGAHCYRVPFGGWAVVPEGYPAPAEWTKAAAGFCYRSDQAHQPIRLGEAVA
ncbi:MAG: polysaccharide biosynthesis protein [Acidobacteria bacterium]|nr:polysaccharide biosynthesis protein [Acidobacteriota bacterium]